MDRSRKIALFGGTGFIGSYILNELSNNSFSTNLLVRNESENKIKKANKLNIITGELSHEDSIRETIKNCDTIIYAVGIIREDKKTGITFDKLHYEYFRNIVDIAKNSSIKKIIYISANGVKLNGTKYQSTKYKAEQYLQNNFDCWTIYRPSVVLGDPRGRMEFITQLKEDIIDKHFPAPLFFKINPFKSNKFFKSNPVHVTDLSKIIVKSISSKYSANKIHKIGGLNEVTWTEMLFDIAKVLNKKKIFIPTPISLIYLIARLFDRFPSFPITAIQIKMLKEDNICDSSKLFEQFKIKPRSFSTDNIQYLINNQYSL